MKNPRLHRRGFTLIELMVSLVMGLIVALAAVGLARNATTAFHEQARSSTAQMSLRMASDRLRQDLMRTSYMSTGNILIDPRLSRLDGVSGVAGARYLELQSLPLINVPLRGIAIDVDMTTMGGVPAALTNNGLSPDAIYLVGNFKSDEAYTGSLAPNGCGGTGQTVVIDATSDAPTYFLSLNAAGTVDKDVLLANAKLLFTPTNPATPSVGPYLAQVTDGNGCTNYVPVCKVTTGISPTGATELRVEVDGLGAVANPVLVNVNGNGERVRSGCGADLQAGNVTVAPLAMVRWSVQKSEAMLDQTDPGIEAAGDKFDLVREMFDFKGVLFQKEVVAEYVVDLKFGISIDDPTAVGALRQKVYDSEDSTSADMIRKVTMEATPVIGPQRIRSVRYRLASRVAIPDRDNGLDLDAGPTLARFCTDYPACKKWARVRTLNSEVVLSNQMGMLY